MKASAILWFLLPFICSSAASSAQLGFTVEPFSRGQRNVVRAHTLFQADLSTPSTIAAYRASAVAVHGAPLPPVARTPIPVNTKMRIVGESGNEYILEIVHDTSPAGTLKFNGSGEREYYTAVKTDVENNTTRNIRVQPVAGAFAQPFKWRPQSGKFETGFSISAGGGIEIPLGGSEDSPGLMFLLGVGSSNIPIRQADVDTAMKLSQTTNLGALTTSFMGMFVWKHLQIGLTAGMDHLFENEVAKWKYQDNWWVSFGIGAKLFTAD